MTFSRLVSVKMYLDLSEVTYSVSNIDGDYVVQVNMYRSTALLIPVILFSSYSLEGPVGDRTPTELAGAAAIVDETLQVSDEALATVRRLDRADRAPDGTFPSLPASEHFRRATVYMVNRAFAEARSHWQSLIERFPRDGNVPASLYGIGRSYFQEHRYAESLPLFERVARTFPNTKEGREGLNSSAAALLRMGRPSEAALRYAEYTEKYPLGERIETAYLNVIDSYREADCSSDAVTWINRTRDKFGGSATGVNAIFARLRLEVADGSWAEAVKTADQLRPQVLQNGVLTSPAEVQYLKAYSLERESRLEDAIASYLSIPDDGTSYYGAQATVHLLGIETAARKREVIDRVNRVRINAKANASLYPIPYRDEILREASARQVDPRLILAIMRQESRFRPGAKSPAAARGLLQLTIDSATKYATRVGLHNLREDDLYRPHTSILIGSEYIAELGRMFANLPEAVAASYNGGEDNVARWVKRAKQPDPGMFTSEIGFVETKNYVFKVMANYRSYKELYTGGLRRR